MKGGKGGPALREMRGVRKVVGMREITDVREG